MPTARRQSGGVLQEAHGPLPLGNVAVYCRSAIGHCAQVPRYCTAREPLPTALGSAGVYCMSPIAHCLGAVWQ